MNILKGIWSPTRVHGGGSTPVGASASIVESLITIPCKFVGRTLTLGAGLAVTAVGLKVLAGTSVGAALGTTAFVATMSAFPLAVLITAAVGGTVATGLLTSYLIEKYTPC